jgi:signal transduction histidine kinase
MRVDDEDEREQLLDHVGSEMVRISRLVRSLLRLAELDEAELSPSGRGPVDLDTLLAEEAARADSFDADVTVRVVGEAGGINGWGDALREALSNVLDNCVRHARHEVVVTVRGQADTVAVRVTDDGDGLPDGAEKAVFERFVSLDDGGGSGLGLPIARAIARAHAGDLIYEDRAFVFSVPR